MDWRCQTLGPGSVVIDFKGRPWQLPDSQRGIVVRALSGARRGKALGYIFWDEWKAGKGPRPYIDRDYIYLESAWVDPSARGKGAFRAMMRLLLRRYPQMPITGLATDRMVRRVLNRICALPQRTYSGFYAD